MNVDLLTSFINILQHKKQEQGQQQQEQNEQQQQQQTDPRACKQWVPDFALSPW